MKTYSEKLKDPRWQKKRLEVFQRAGFKCEACGDGEETLQVHHLVYVTGGEPWDSPIEDLESLCQTCHEWRENFNKWWGGRSRISTGVCLSFEELYEPIFNGEEKRAKLCTGIFSIYQLVYNRKFGGRFPQLQVRVSSAPQDYSI